MEKTRRNQELDNYIVKGGFIHGYDLPLLIINEEGVREEGIIKGGRFSVKTQNFNLDKIDDFFNDEIVNHQIAVWVGKVTDYYLFLNLKKV